jgi:hypothetical protein
MGTRWRTEGLSLLPQRVIKVRSHTSACVHCTGWAAPATDFCRPYRSCLPTILQICHHILSDYNIQKSRWTQDVTWANLELARQGHCPLYLNQTNHLTSSDYSAIWDGYLVDLISLLTNVTAECKEFLFRIRNILGWNLEYGDRM